ncbi:stage III sporulation protein AF [Caldibacillus lycopersici]|uniref:Stage III sporulation protein AF n=1 Tax=Perspicuibacillus lycopersici TaxID=1325689 RepID=A0AAE3ISJ4_9BACI|nr:stage III sporulation protein AF [Perspicuibacillus lycopersici]MCU9613838.1 stage III sporulation protein AF [Perspicuibacillus lycopersici]
MEFLSEWITNILLFILLAVVVELLLPQTNLQKYVKMVLGLLLIVIILTPIFQLFSVDANELLHQATKEADRNNSSIENSIENKKIDIQAEQRAYILEETAVQLEELTQKELMERFNLQIKDIQLVVNDTFDNTASMENIMESIDGITVVLEEAKGDDQTAVEVVQEVKIDTNEGVPKEDTNVIDSSVASFLSDNWGVDMETIHITVERGNSGNE